MSGERKSSNTNGGVHYCFAMALSNYFIILVRDVEERLMVMHDILLKLKKGTKK